MNKSMTPHTTSEIETAILPFIIWVTADANEFLRAYEC